MILKDLVAEWDAFVESCKGTRRRPNRRAALSFAKKAGMRSMGEVKLALNLQERGVKWAYEDERLNYVLEKTYTPDFSIWTTTHANSKVLIEYKGVLKPETRTKMKHIRLQHPERRIAIVFENSTNKLSAKPNSVRYWQWAERNGYPWSHKVVKDEWFREGFWKKFMEGKK